MSGAGDTTRCVACISLSLFSPGTTQHSLPCCSLVSWSLLVSGWATTLQILVRGAIPLVTHRAVLPALGCLGSGFTPDSVSSLETPLAHDSEQTVPQLTLEI